MKKLMIFCALVLLMAGVAGASTTINFDNLGSLLNSSGFYYDQINPVGFVSEGFQFDMGLMNETGYHSYYNTGTFPSSSIAVYSNSANDPLNPFSEITISRVDGQAFNFLGANIGGFTLSNTIPWFASPSLMIEGYRNDVLVGSMEINPLIAGFNFISASLMGVDTLKFIPAEKYYDYSNLGYANKGTGSYWMMDNFTYSTVVPVPGAILLGGIGVSLVGWLKRRKSL